MGIQVEFNLNLALRDYSEFEKGNRKLEECIPQDLEAGKVYDFLKSGQRNYWLEGEIPLVKTEGNQQLSRPLASIVIEEATHFIKEDEIYTRGKYRVVDVFDINDSMIHFEAMEKVR